MSYWKWGFSIAMLVYQRVIPPNGGTCFYKVRSKGLTKLQPWRVLRNAYHCMTLHVQAMHNSPTAFSNHRRSTWVSLMRPNRCSIWAPLLVQFLEREHTRYRKFSSGTSWAPVPLHLSRTPLGFGIGFDSAFVFILELFVLKAIVKRHAFSNSRQFGSSNAAWLGHMRLPNDHE